jgi:hypothetical protein
MPLPCLPELYSQAHDIICDELAPEAILSETYLELEELLALLADPERFSTIADWYGRGKRILLFFSFFDYGRICKSKFVSRRIIPVKRECN